MFETVAVIAILLAGIAGGELVRVRLLTWGSNARHSASPPTRRDASAGISKDAQAALPNLP